MSCRLPTSHSTFEIGWQITIDVLSTPGLQHEILLLSSFVMRYGEKVGIEQVCKYSYLELLQIFFIWPQVGLGI